MGKEESVPSRQYTDKFKAEAVRLAGSTGGKPAAECLGIPQSTMAHWVRRSKAGTLSLADASPVKRPLSELELENALMREVVEARRKRPRRRPAAPVEQGEDPVDRPVEAGVFAQLDDMLARHRAQQLPLPPRPARR